MSVHLSHVEFNPQFTDEDEAELEREEWEQQQDLKEFLEREMGDDTFEVSFASYHSQSNHSSDKLSQKTQVLAVNENHPEPYQNGTHQYDPRADPALMKGINGGNHRNYMNSTTYNGQTPTKYGNASKPSQDYYNMSAASHHYPTNDDVFNNNERTAKDFNKQYIEDSQLHVLYNARGKKIESLEIEKEEQKEKFAKEIRVLQHKLTMITSEKDGLSTSNQQQQNLIIEHKQEIAMLEKELHKEQEDKSKLNKELQELNEKLFASDCALDTLQQQIKQMNQTESVSRARAQHESMLATMRQRHEEEVLNLKEKLDDLQQALAWKTEDVNRYREMLDSNSSVSEIGILRNRLSLEERKNNELQIEMEKHRSKYFECEEQLKLYEGLVKMQAAQLTSTPLPSNVNNALMDKHDLDKTPCTTNIRTNEMDTIGLGPCDTSFREELVKSLSINREKRHQMNVLRDQLEYFQKQLHGRQNVPVEHRITQTDSAELGEYCEQCKKLQALLDEKVDELKSSQDEIKRHENDKAELRSNMSDMVKRFDKQKLDDLQNQNKATLQLIDDVKANLLQEVQKAHDAEKEQFQNEIDSLNGELLHTKEDYLKLCTEVKDLEDNLRKEFDVERRRELDDLKRTLDVDYANKLSAQEVKLTNQYVDDLEKEKQKWVEDNEKGNADKIEKSLMLAKSDWIESYNTKRGSNVGGVGEKNEVVSLKEKCLKLEETVRELEAKCTDEQQDFNVELEAAKAFWEEEQQKLFEEKLTKVELNEKEKMDAELKNAIKDCNDKWEEEIKKIQTSLNDQTSLSRKVELDFKLKSALWERTEGELKRKIDSLRKEANKSCEKCEQAKESSNQNNASNNSNEDQSNISSSDMCERCFEAFKGAESSWLIKEKELHLLLQEAHNHIGIKLTELKSNPESAQTAHTNKEIGTEMKFTDAHTEVNHWKELYEESKKQITDLNDNIISIKDDLVLAEKCYEQKLESLQKQLARVQEDLGNTEKELASEKENGKEANAKYNELKTNKVELVHNNMMLKNEKTALENKLKNDCDLLQNEINTLKDTVLQLQAELESEKERYIKLKVDYDKLTETAMSENTSIVSTRYSMESEYDKKYKDLAAECNNWKSKYLDVEKENSELDRNLQLQLSNVTKTENYFKKQVETLQGEIETLNNSMNQVQSELFVEKEKSAKLDLECKQMTKNYNMNLENVLNVEKQKWQIESAKLQEAVLKASEIDHNNFVKEIQSQTNHINEISKMKEEHELTVRNLKQGFRDKLARITEMKKKWIREEEEKRSQIEKKIKEKYATKFSELQEQHEGILRDQQTHWIKEIHQSKKEQLTVLAGLREEVKIKDNLLLKERKTFQENEAEQKYKMKELMTSYTREVEKLKVEHLNELQSEKKRVEQYFKLFYENSSSQNNKDGSISSGKKENSSKNIEVEIPVKDALEEVEPTDAHGRTRQFYLETLERIQQDVMEHVTLMRHNADNEIKDAVERERKKIFHELRERNITTSSPKLDNMDDRGFGSQTFTNSMINGSCMAFKDLPHDG